eukprot:TRINITY_DN4672_c0_g1_i1.p1 TRINITY_DN4672_c0_g1~~TRINITY_DN4672_c0_g1_i1.p1  ORF type:complete len:164 (+),score=50.56 TRINITY_DN4672_c0_g1_i1:79-570(+)
MATQTGSQLPSEVAAQLQQFHASLEDVRSVLKVLDGRSINELCKSLSPADAARLHVLLAYSINSLFYMYLNTQGVQPKDHPVKAELDRVKLYMAKLKELEKAPKPTTQVDVPAAGRFIRHNLPSTTKTSPDAAGIQDGKIKKSTPETPGKKTAAPAQKTPKAK